MENTQNIEVKIAKIVAGVIIGFIALWILVIQPLTIITAGTRGIVMTWGKVEDRLLDEGLHYVIPIAQKVKIVDVKTQTINFDFENALGAASKDLQDVGISVIVNYHQDPNEVGYIYKTYGASFNQQVIEPIVREVTKAVASQFTAEELVTKRIEFSALISSKLAEQISLKSGILEKVNIVNLQFSKSFTQAIEAKVTAEQDALAAKNKLEQIKFEAEQRVTTAKGEAEAIRIQAQAITQQGGEDYVRLKWVEKWNGVLPSTMLGENTPIVSIK